MPFSDHLDRMDKLINDYNKEKNELIGILKQFAGPEAWNVVCKNNVGATIECDVSSITDPFNEKDKSSTSNSSTSEIMIPNTSNSGLFDKKNLVNIYKEKGGSDISCMGFLFALPRPKKKFPKKNADLDLDNILDNSNKLHFVFFLQESRILV